MAPHSSKMKSSVKPKASRSELSIASAKSIVLVFSWPISQIWLASMDHFNVLYKKKKKRKEKQSKLIIYSILPVAYLALVQVEINK